MPVLLRDVAQVTDRPEIRRGLADWNGEGETVGGIVVVRAGADTRSTIERVKERGWRSSRPGCPRTWRSPSPTTAAA